MSKSYLDLDRADLTQFKCRHTSTPQPRLMLLPLRPGLLICSKLGMSARTTPTASANKQIRYVRALSKTCQAIEGSSPRCKFFSHISIPVFSLFLNEIAFVVLFFPILFLDLSCRNNILIFVTVIDLHRQQHVPLRL